MTDGQPGYHIATSGVFFRKRHLSSREKLSPADFAAIAKALGRAPLAARKIGFVAARQVAQAEHVETRWDGKETENTAEAGDWIVTSLTPDQAVMRDGERNTNSYVIAEAKFPELYDTTPVGENDFGTIHKSRSRIQALRLNGGFAIMAPWDAMQEAPDGYLVLNGDEVYGNNRATFEASYEVLD